MGVRPTLNLKAPKEKDEKDAGEDETAAEESWPPCHACFKHSMWAMLADNSKSLTFNRHTICIKHHEET